MESKTLNAADKSAIPTPGENHSSTENLILPLTREQLLEALDAQIKFITDDQRKAGWTRWAIWGALAAIAWKATELCYQKDFTTSRTILLSMGLFATWRLLELFATLLSPSAKVPATKVGFLIMRDVVNAARLELAVSLARHAIIIFALFCLGFPRMWILWFYSVASFLFYIVMFAQGLMTFPLSTRPQNTKALSFSVGFIQIALLLGVIFQAFCAVRGDVENIKLSELRLALLVNAAACLVGWLASASTAAPLLISLTQIRQDLAFGRLSLRAAIKHTDLAVTGLKLAEVLQPYASGVLKEVSELQPLLAEMKKRVAEINTNVSDLPSQSLSEEENRERVARVFRLLDELHKEIDRINDKMRDVKRARDRLQVHSAVITIFSPDSKPEIETITQAASAAMTLAEKEAKELHQQHLSLKEKANLLAKQVNQTVAS